MRFVVMQKKHLLWTEQQEAISSNAVCGRGFARLPAQVQAKLRPFRLPVSLAKGCETAHKQLCKFQFTPTRFKFTEKVQRSDIAQQKVARLLD